MNKGAKKRAFFICAAIFVMYLMVGFGITDKVTMKRIADSKVAAPDKMNLAVPKVTARREPGVAEALNPKPNSTPFIA